MKSIKILNKNNKEIYGQLDCPSIKGPWKTIVIFHGSGMSDRDGTVQLLGKKTFGNFKLLSEELTKAGFAVFRYDKRDGFIINNIVSDAEAVVSYLLKMEEISELYFYGWSEGARVQAEIVKKFPDIKGMIFHSGITGGWKEYFRYLLVELATEKLIELDLDNDGIIQLEDLNRFIPNFTSTTFALSSLVIKRDNNGQVSISNYLDKDSRGSFSINKDWLPVVKSIVKDPLRLSDYGITPPSEVWNGFLNDIKDFNNPILVLHGLNDGWVDPIESVKLVKAKRNVADIVLFKGLGHSLQKVNSPLKDEGGKIESEAIKVIREWLLKVSNQN